MNINKTLLGCILAAALNAGEAGEGSLNGVVGLTAIDATGTGNCEASFEVELTNNTKESITNATVSVANADSADGSALTSLASGDTRTVTIRVTGDQAACAAWRNGRAPQVRVTWAIDSDGRRDVLPNVRLRDERKGK